MEMTGNGWKWLRMAGMGKKLLEMAKMALKIGWIWLDKDIHDWNGWKDMDVDENG